MINEQLKRVGNGMKLTLEQDTLRLVQLHGEQAYPNEGAGFLLGRFQDGIALVDTILPLTNSREAEAQRNRYLLTERDYLHGEQQAAERGLDVVGVFHSHPDHPAYPSEFDRAHALPNCSYLITSVHVGKALESRSWRLRDDRSAFTEE